MDWGRLDDATRQRARPQGSADSAGECMLICWPFSGEIMVPENRPRIATAAIG